MSVCLTVCWVEFREEIHKVMFVLTNTGNLFTHLLTPRPKQQARAYGAVHLH